MYWAAIHPAGLSVACQMRVNFSGSKHSLDRSRAVPDRFGSRRRLEPSTAGRVFRDTILPVGRAGSREATAMQEQENELLWRFYQDHIAHGRHHETLRATTTTVILAVAAGVLGLLGGAHVWPLQYEQLPLTLFLVLLGVFGAFFSAKYHERFDFHMNRARQYRDLLDANLPLVGINKVRPEADKKSRSEHPWLFDRRLYVFWVWLHLIVAGLGLLLTLSIFWPRPTAGYVAPPQVHEPASPNPKGTVKPPS
jgi:hypothetical protein